MSKISTRTAVLLLAVILLAVGSAGFFSSKSKKNGLYALNNKNTQNSESSASLPLLALDSPAALTQLHEAASSYLAQVEQKLGNKYDSAVYHAQVRRSFSRLTAVENRPDQTENGAEIDYFLALGDESSDSDLAEAVDFLDALAFSDSEEAPTSAAWYLPADFCAENPLNALRSFAPDSLSPVTNERIGNVRAISTAALFLGGAMAFLPFAAMLGGWAPSSEAIRRTAFFRTLVARFFIRLSRDFYALFSLRRTAEFSSFPVSEYLLVKESVLLRA